MLAERQAGELGGTLGQRQRDDEQGHRHRENAVAERRRTRQVDLALPADRPPPRPPAPPPRQPSRKSIDECGRRR